MQLFTATEDLYHVVVANNPGFDHGLSDSIYNHRMNFSIHDSKFSLSLSTVVLNSRDRQGNLWLP